MKCITIVVVVFLFVLSAPRPGAAQGSASAVVINELQTQGAGGATDEFVELFNPTSSSVAIGGWLLKRSSSTGIVTTLAAIPVGTSLAANHSYLFGGPAYADTVDQSYANPIANDGGVAVTTAEHNVVDAVGLSIGSAFLEGNVAPSAPAGESVQRQPEGWDSNDNGADFTIGDASPLTSAVTHGGRFHPLPPTRILDTRTTRTPLGPGETRLVAVTGRGAVPVGGVSAVVVNATVTEPTAPGYLTVFPAGAARPTASNLNFVGGQTVPNLVTVKVGEGGAVALFNSSGRTHVVLDLNGYFDTSPVGPDGRYVPVTPSRVLDTRATQSPLRNGERRSLRVTGVAGVPAAGVSAVVVNLTVTEPTGSGYLTAFPASLDSPPLASNVNFVAGQTVPNRAVVPVPASGQISLFNSVGNTHVIVDIGGWFTDSGSGAGATTTVSPRRLLDTRAGAPVSTDARQLRVAGVGDVPSTASAAILNVTVTNPTSSGWLAVWPAGVTQPVVSDLNFVAGQTVPNLVIVKLGSGGAVNMATGGSVTDVVVDVLGYVT